MDFETSKENIQPLASGRNVRYLEAALNPKSSQELLEERRQFEDEIKNYEGEDPLQPWFQYILWIEQSYPSGGKESGLEEVLIKCLANFESDKRYFQDRRMIKLYIKYIDSQPNPQEYYQELYKQGIGTMVADLYICWAYYYDLCGNFAKADSIFRKGLDARAQPYEELDQAHKHFGYTMSQRILYPDESSQQQFIALLQERRQALTSLRHHKKKVGSIRTGTAVKSINPGKIQVDTTKPGSSRTNAQTHVFEDENKDPNPVLEEVAEIDFASQSVVRSIIDSARKKENEREPGPWGKAKMKAQQPCVSSARGLSFEILEDDSNEQKTVLIPLPSEPNNYIKGIKLELNQVVRNEPQEEWKTSICLEAELPDRAIPMYNKCFAYPKPGKEYSIEEYRGYKWFKDRNIENSSTKKWDTIWGNDVSIGIRLYPNFAVKNKPQPEFKVERFIKDDDINSETVKTIINLKEVYPDSTDEFQIEEILFKRIKNGQRKLRFDLESTILMEADMDETRIVTDAYGRKSIIPSRRSMVPRKSVYMQPVDSHTQQEPIKKEMLATNSSSRTSQVNLPNLSPAYGTFLTTINSKSVSNGENNGQIPEVQLQDVFKAPAPPLPIENICKPIPFQIFEEDEEEAAAALPNNGFGANETCSTQTFNFFIKPQSISTPKPVQKTRSCLLPGRNNTPPEESNTPPEQNITPPEQVFGSLEPGIIDSPEYDNIPGSQPKQLSTIMETTETNTVSSGATTSTKSSDTRMNASEHDAEISKYPHLIKSTAYVTIPEEISDEEHKNVEDVKSKNISLFKIREDTLPTNVLEEKVESGSKAETVSKAETASKTSLVPKPLTPIDEICQLFVKAPEKKQEGPLKSFKIFQEKETVSKPLVTLKPSVENDFSSLFTKTPEKKQTSSLMTSIKIFEDKTETIPKTLLAPKLPSVDDDFVSLFTKTPEKKSSASVGFEMNSTTFPKLKDVTLPKWGDAKKVSATQSESKQELNSSEIKDQNISKKQDGLFLKNSNDSIIPGFEDFNIKDKVNTISLNKSDMKGTSKNLNDTKELVPQSWQILPGSSSNDQKSNESLSIFKKCQSIISSFSIAEKSMDISKLSENIAKSNQSAMPFPKDEILQNKSIKCSDEIVPTQPFTKNLSLRLDQSIKSNSLTKDMRNVADHSRTEVNKSISSHSFITPGNISKKKSDFFEDNIKTEAFAPNLSAIKNSTFLPSYTPTLNFSQIQEKSLHIKEEPDYSCSTSPNTSKISVLSRFSIIQKKHSILPQPNLQENNDKQNHEIRQESLNSATDGNDTLRSSSRDHFQKPIQEGATSEVNEDAFGQSIYFTKTPKTPNVRRHYWSDCDDEPIVEQEHFPPREVDLDETRQYLEDNFGDNNVNPFDVKLINAFLEQIDFYTYLEQLPTCSIVNKISALKKNDVVKVCDRTFEIMKVVAEGGYGTVFCAKDKSTDELFAVKQEKPPNLWEYYICLELKSRLNNINIESAYMDVQYSLIGQNSSLLISAYSKYGSLITVCNKVKRATTRNVDEYIVMLLTSQMLSIMDHLHASNIIHADIKPDNFVLMSQLSFGSKTPVVQLIDFGVSIDMALYPPGQQFLFCSKSDNFKCIEMLENRPWTFQTDLYGLAGVIHVLLFGKYMTVEKNLIGWTHKSRIPRYFNKSIWDSIFNALLNVRDCNSMPNLQNLRAILEEEIAGREKLVRDKIKEFNNAIASY